MIETVVSVDLMVEEELKVKKNHLAPDFPTGEEKRICIVSGLYGDELQGQYICYEVIRRIKLEYENLTGIVDVYPALNPMGLDSKTREIPGSGIDMNSIFPGSKLGALGEYTASCIFDDIKGADVCIDLHASNLYVHEVPQVRMNDDRVDELMPIAKCLNVDMIWIHPSNSVLNGSLAYSLNEVGVRSVVIESGVAYRINQQYCNAIVDGLFALMKEMGIWKGNTVTPKKVPITNDKDIRMPSASTVSPFKYRITRSSSREKSAVCFTSSLRSPIANACEGSNRPFFSVPSIHPVRSTRSFSSFGVPSGRRYSPSP